MRGSCKISQRFRILPRNSLSCEIIRSHPSHNARVRETRSFPDIPEWRTTADEAHGDSSVSVERWLPFRRAGWGARLTTTKNLRQSLVVGLIAARTASADLLKVPVLFVAANTTPNSIARPDIQLVKVLKLRTLIPPSYLRLLRLRIPQLLYLRVCMFHIWVILYK